MASRIPVGPMMPLPVPRQLPTLHDLAYNLWWSWDTAATALWSTIDALQWARLANPIPLLQQVKPDRWEAVLADPSFVDRYHDVERRFQAHLIGEGSWFTKHHPESRSGPIAYLCAEYGIQQKMRLYSGGLGVLAGDHVKAASDLGLPLVAVGLLYRKGYFQQAVDPDGNQQHTFLPMDPSRRPIRRVLDPRTGLPLQVVIDLPGRSISVAAWRLDVGRVPLLLLDTDIAENDPADRPITHILYVRGREMRFTQELVLGIGGARVLSA
ncbi:MAG: alpha-glucan family phosphorylase, partial [Acidimicrobiia bacterium]